MLVNELVKNAKVIVRNWSSLLLLVLGPIAMMVIIGLTFSATQVHDIVIGVSGNASLVPMVGASQTVQFDDLGSCMRAVETGEVKICLDVRQDAQVQVTFFFDPSEKKLANLVIA